MSAAGTPWDQRHPSVSHFEPLFAFDHLPQHLQEISGPFHQLAQFGLITLDDGPELSAGLRKLLEAKDCIVRQAVIDGRKPGPDYTAEVDPYGPKQVLTWLKLIAYTGGHVSEMMATAWTSEQRREVVYYCSAVHLSASDNDNEVPPKPEVLP